jgi:hypothetical protein
MKRESRRRVTEATLRFRAQADGRRVSRMPDGRVVLVRENLSRRVGDRERWVVRLVPCGSFMVAEPLERISGFTNSMMADALRGFVDMRRR